MPPARQGQRVSANRLLGGGANAGYGGGGGETFSLDAHVLTD